MSFVSFPPVQRVYGTASSSWRFFPTTPWLPAVQFKTIKAVYELLDVDGAVQVRMGFQTATVDQDAPNSAVNITGAATSGGKTNSGRVSVSPAYSDDHYWIRFGVIVSCSTDGTYAQAEVGVWFTGDSV